LKCRSTNNLTSLKCARNAIIPSPKSADRLWGPFTPIFNGIQRGVLRRKQGVAYRTLSFNDEVKYDPELYLHPPQKPSKHTQRNY
jgi:hypothetical protein